MLNDTINLYAGFDAREEIGYHTFCSSVIHGCSIPISITPVGNALLEGVTMGRRSDESTDFARVRFLIPWMLGYKGWALFCDGSDMLVKADLGELWDLRDPYKAVQVVKHDYRTKHPRKFVGTEMECDNRDYPRKNWSSVMIINCANFSWRCISPSTINDFSGEVLHQFKFLPEERIGELPDQWNWLVDEYGADRDAKLLHWTAGIPAFPHYANAPMADEWAAAALLSAHATTT